MESEAHFLIVCHTYAGERIKGYNVMNIPIHFEDLSTPAKLRLILNEPSDINLTDIYIANSLYLRSRLSVVNSW